MKIRISAITDVGKERTNNEDAFVFCSDLTKHEWLLSETNGYIPLNGFGVLGVVADGMGGANAGEVASSIAVAVTKDCFDKADIPEIVKSSENMGNMMKATIKKIDNAIQKRVKDEPETIGMGTTIVMVWITDKVSLTAWCGDSRCYRFTPADGLVRLSKDHSYVQTLIDNGEITERQALTHEENSVITRCLGDADTQSEPELKEFKVNVNEMILLCSDGLCGYCMDSEIEKVMYKTFTDTAECKDALLGLAYDKGGLDNITIIGISVMADNDSVPQIGKHAYLKMRLKSFLRKLAANGSR